MFVEVANANDLPVGRVRVCTVGERRIALYHTARGFFATGNTCPHRGGPLGEGDTEGPIVICPWHGWRWDVTTGANANNPAVRVSCYPVSVEQGAVFVTVA